MGFGGEGTVLNIPSKDIEDSHYDEKKYSIRKVRVRIIEKERYNLNVRIATGPNERVKPMGRHQIQNTSHTYLRISIGSGIPA